MIKQKDKEHGELTYWEEEEEEEQMTETSCTILFKLSIEYEKLTLVDCEEAGLKDIKPI